MATTDKYDRQLRLWGINGQKAVSETCIVLIRATSCGTETLKNLILPGIGSFVILDDVIDYTNEYESNFFLINQNENENKEQKSKKCRAEIAYELLQELNPDVIGSWKHYNTNLQFINNWTIELQTILQEQRQTNTTIKNFIIIGSDLEPNLLQTISKSCYNDLSISYINIVSYGLIGYVQIQSSTLLPLIDTKQRTHNSTPDLRLLYPFLSLQNTLTTFCNTDWTLLDNKDHGHIPYPYILYKAYQIWLLQQTEQQQTEQPTEEQQSSILNEKQVRIPKTFIEKQNYQSIIKSLSRNYNNELNFQEAITNAYLLYTPKCISLDRIQSLLNTVSSSITGSTNSSSLGIQKFYILLKGLYIFLMNRTESIRQYSVPVIGTIPDMTSSTTLYIQLQTIYKNQSIHDLNELKMYIQQQQQSIAEIEAEATTTTTTKFDISDDEIQTFISNVYNLNILETGSIESMYTTTITTNTSDGTTNNTDETICNELISFINDEYEDSIDIDEDDGDGTSNAWKQSPLVWYFGIRACQLFYTTYGYYPGCTNKNNNNNKTEEDDYDESSAILLEDATKLQSCMELLFTTSTKYNQLQNEKLFQKTLLNCNSDGSSLYSIELVRYGNCQIHTISSIIGGIASQEIIKLITNQYIPINNTYVYNGIASIGGTYKL